MACARPVFFCRSYRQHLPCNSASVCRWLRALLHGCLCLASNLSLPSHHLRPSTARAAFASLDLPEKQSVVGAAPALTWSTQRPSVPPLALRLPDPGIWSSCRSAQLRPWAAGPACVADHAAPSLAPRTLAPRTCSLDPWAPMLFCPRLLLTHHFRPVPLCSQGGTIGGMTRKSQMEQEVS